MGVKKGEKYNLRIFIKKGTYNGGIKVRLVSPSGLQVASAETGLESDGKWNEYRLQLEALHSEAKALLAIDFSGPGSLWIDYVSLFPENTFMKRPNGLRKDVAEFLAELHPAFIRWPGGCIVEGISLVNRVEWKKTLGDPAGRPGQYDTWGYRNTYGFGYHEFLQYCEDIGAGGMFVCNVGLGCQYRCGDACPAGEVKSYVADALDAIEYAIGDTTTVWGARRAAAGHPGVFPLKYVEIGNENWGPLYNERCEIFYKAIKERYPELTLISNHGLKSDMTGVTKVDMIDPHWYVEPGFFFSNTTVFDTIPRGKHLIYVGEYACNQKVGGGNMLAALSEAAFITGMERNGDLVRMASYAPLFENRNDRTWPVNLIWFDNMQVVGRSSYYVQKMMAANRPSFNIAAELKAKTGIEGDSLRQFTVAGYDEKSGDLVIKVVNAEESSWSAGIKLLNCGKIKGKGTVITLEASSLKDENSYENPLLISPVESEYFEFSDDFNYEFSPCSLTILRIKIN
jgi:alpha-L-arabinofuranosidase